ncbi:kinase-like protein, partial [Sistotremastrum suecicum HHB10207 ss-3]
MSSVFDVIPYEDLTHPFRTIGTGSFGSVYRSEYLGLPVALKQIQPSKDYDVQKYFEREWRLMKEARHPNVVLYLGLSRSPEKVTYIVSEFVEGGNMRSYIHHKRKPFPWTMRVSFAIDVARALAYLHARKCIHRDLKPENLLLTANGRVKITDFGFARIAPRNDDEQKRITFCGTDAYMSPEILLGESFGLSTDIFSLGVIFCEVISRTLADDSRGDFRRNPATWGLDAQEVRQKANDGCPEDFVQLSLDCLQLEPNDRPDCREILERLSRIEVEILQREKDSDTHVGSVKFVAGKRPNMAPRIPSFG